jgi:nitric oxide dioxygenase
VSSLADVSKPSLLSPEALDVVWATAPVVAAHADQITAHFYPRMFAAHPELLRVFNQGNQATGEQSKALAGSVVAYAVQLIDPEAPSFDHVMRRIAYKHVSLGIRPEQYTIVGEHLLASVGEVLGDAVTPEVAAAWSEVYWLFALQLVAAEARLYLQANIDPAQPTRPYRMVRRIEETADVITLVLEPTDGSPLPAIAPGQVRLGVRRPARWRSATSPVHRVLHCRPDAPADHRATCPWRQMAAFPAISMIECRSGTCLMSAPRLATSC